MRELRELIQIHELDLEHTPVTDVGLQCLKGLHRLQDLNLCSTGVTAAGVESLQKVLPKARIAH